MKKLLLLILTIVLTVVSVDAQKRENGKSREEMRKELDDFKMKFVAQEIELRQDQQEKFYELYSQMQRQRGEIFDKTHKIERKLRKNTNASEDDYAAAAKVMAEAREADARLEKQFDEKFAKFLSQKQIYKMKEAEGKFRQRMDEMHRDNKRKKDK